MPNKNIRVIFDTNVWISFLIGKRLVNLVPYFASKEITIVITEQLLIELKRVTEREKLKKYFPKERVKELIDLLEIIGEKEEIIPKHFICRDPKDNFLFDLIEVSNADYLVTGDKDLLEHHPFKTAQILTPTEFEKLFEK